MARLSTTDPNEWAIEPEIQFGAARTAWLLTKYACRAIHMQVEISVLVFELQRMPAVVQQLVGQLDIQPVVGPMDGGSSQ